MADIKKIKLPNGTEFDIKDETARSQMEISANKVTSIDSASTDSQYPSAKAVYDAIPTVPTNVSSFTNDAGYLTLSTLPIYDGSVT